MRHPIGRPHWMGPTPWRARSHPPGAADRGGAERGGARGAGRPGVRGHMGAVTCAAGWGGERRRVPWRMGGVDLCAGWELEGPLAQGVGGLVLARRPGPAVQPLPRDAPRAFRLGPSRPVFEPDPFRPGPLVSNATRLRPGPFPPARWTRAGSSGTRAVRGDQAKGRGYADTRGGEWGDREEEGRREGGGRRGGECPPTGPSVPRGRGDRSRRRDRSGSGRVRGGEGGCAVWGRRAVRVCGLVR